MTMRKILTLAILPLFLVGCLDSDDGDGGMKEEDRARAAASASVLTGSLSAPDNDDDDGSGVTPLSVLRGGSPMKMEPCAVSGEVTSGGGFENVGSPYTNNGEIDLTWQDYDSCVQTTDTEFDGYMANGTAETGNVSYSAWSSGRGDGIDPANNQFVMDWSDGTWRFGGELHNCSNCSMGGLAGFEANLEWVIEAQGEKVTFGFGESGNYMQFSGTGQDGGQVQETINGPMRLQWHGTPCEYDVDYETVTPLVVNNYGTTSEVIASGELDLTLSTGTTFRVRYDNGDIYIDGELIDPNEPNPCDGAFDVLSAS